MGEQTVEEQKEKSNRILQLEEWTSLGTRFTTFGIMKVLYGEVQKNLIKHEVDLIHEQWVYDIIPRTDVVVILHIQADDFDGEMQKTKTLYIFSPLTGGWKTIMLK